MSPGLVPKPETPHWPLAHLRACLGALSLLLSAASGCGHLPLTPAEPPQALAARKLLAAFAQRARVQDVNGLAALFSPHCLSSCTGYLPMPVAVQGQTVRGRWLPRLEPGQLLADLAALLQAYAPDLELQLSIQRLQAHPPGLALVRAVLFVRGQDGAGRPLRDQGLVDLELRELPAGWRIHRLALAQVERVVTLLPGERAPSLTDSPAPEVLRQAQPATEPEPEVQGPGLALPGDPLTLTVGKAHQPLSQLAGTRATVIVLRAAACPSCAALCQLLQRALGGREGLRLIELIDQEPAEPACPLPQALRAVGDAAAQKLLQRLESLLPLVAVVGPQTPAQWLVAPEAATLEAALDQLAPR